MCFTLHGSPTAPSSSLGTACPWEHVAHRWAQVSISTCQQPPGRGPSVAAGQGEDARLSVHNHAATPGLRSGGLWPWSPSPVGGQGLLRQSMGGIEGHAPTRGPLCSCFGGGPMCSLSRVPRPRPRGSALSTLGFLSNERHQRHSLSGTSAHPRAWSDTATGSACQGDRQTQALSTLHPVPSRCFTERAGRPG